MTAARASLQPPLPLRPRDLTIALPDPSTEDHQAGTDLTGCLLTGAPTAAPHRVLTAAGDRQRVADSARLVTYNTLTGGIDCDRDEWRRRKQIEFLASLDADLIALQELRGWDEGGWWRLWKAANLLGMVPLPPVISARGRGNDLALLYRPGSVRIDDYDNNVARGAFHHGLGRARLYVRDQPLLTVLFTHLSFLGGAERYAEARWLTGYGNTYKGEPQRVVLLGDLNSIGEHDPEPDWNRIPSHLHSRHRHLTASGAFGDTDRRAIQLLARAGFRDPFDLLGLGPARTAGYWSKTDLVDHRSDFILPNRHAADQVTGAAVHDTEETRLLSDHLPVVLELAPPAA
ncbi:endonuclease/exonuclease/phosphatase family protein [Streptomyces sp. QH1-20]|uniref:endonuclease/exonuclease/phosphatase family protein n=1 Tax=Streptomyces sp. QH1-20 TaxID=3240934 RepID=UPI0035130007